MSFKDPIHEGQLEVLRWIGDGCPDGRWQGHTYKTIASALASRRLVTISKKGGQWRAELLSAGTYYLEHGDYPSGHWKAQKNAAAPSDFPSVRRPPARQSRGQLARPQHRASRSRRESLSTTSSRLAADWCVRYPTTPPTTRA